MSKAERLLNELLDWVSNNINPADVYGHDVLIAWSKDHGMISVDELKKGLEKLTGVSNRVALK
ncbi:MAG: hypothetical protein H8D37_00500 [Chloroflexi bacterium]|nr:hypothetical protein [Chloroflexota bacterium]